MRLDLEIFTERETILNYLLIGELMAQDKAIAIPIP